ncbi:hypothetical protein FAZ19_07895 [Sphingobacterium alkalisoli]|uniref:Carbohydrate-binding domain-containing protein n=1 Tax=Sphingobacterium alkalisoli TaxID=1874115 RepID=A0A4U0H544_9SPHI|nr:carbohydrate-binding family 9-like protein [Sphingobacterium alkalisoli]TJY66825.1 hypothetical protein FAZ19_07895 [Sphingobacterium alkalisoli]GGH13985.1 hypothetical protein GCM10011418_14560 [Sphingobacterium alkalisoli]
MNSYQILIFIVCLSLNAPTGVAQSSIDEIATMQSLPLKYQVFKTDERISIDGKADEVVWKKAPWTSDFMDIEGAHQLKPMYKTATKMLWDNEFLYIYAELEDPHIWGDITTHDAIIYHNNDFEIFIKPFEQHPFYYEIEINPLNTVMDLMMPKPYRFGGEAIMSWDVKNLKSAVHIEGTLNNPSDKDSYWSVEIAIPFTSLNTFGRPTTPKVNSLWRINFSRVQWQYEYINGKYSRKKHENGKPISEDNWVWSPIGVINMHYPERWGYLQFMEEDKKQDDYITHANQKIAWNIFYLQQLHRQKNGRFSVDIATLEGYRLFLENDLKSTPLTFLTNDDQTFFHIIIKDPATPHTFSLDSHGNYNISYE